MNYEKESWSGKMPDISLKKDNANYDEFFKTMLSPFIIGTQYYFGIALGFKVITIFL